MLKWRNYNFPLIRYRFCIPKVITNLAIKYIPMDYEQEIIYNIARLGDIIWCSKTQMIVLKLY